MEEKAKIPDVIAAEECLYRGIVENQWDPQNNRSTSAVFKDSKGVSVDRDALVRGKDECVTALLQIKQFKAVCRVKQEAVDGAGAITKYLPIQGNIYHSEIHDSENKVSLTGSKAKKLKDASEVVYQI